MRVSLEHSTRELFGHVPSVHRHVSVEEGRDFFNRPLTVAEGEKVAAVGVKAWRNAQAVVVRVRE